ncbi:hypothetical protein DN069_04215 [Streptacidiphilus pinicola]|uniref:Uncharacterized protein n=1 Tax=Streptacidiphilus pinicola TaxID=2219663 RepID=A0A2X0JGS7_9ACTN|nr:hypothetical protein [Streptacidiphilus pinicola]RAG86868.1 hypothetical protein DN069_04215 [Streptacidiphilus pinicola]
MEQQHGRALSQRERQVLVFIEQELRQDEALDAALSELRPPRPRWWPRRRRRSGGNGTGRED